MILPSSEVVDKRSITAAGRVSASRLEKLMVIDAVSICGENRSKHEGTVSSHEAEH